MTETDDRAQKIALRLAPLSEIILYKLYEAHVEDDTKDRYNFDDINEMLAGQSSRKLTVSAIKLLIARRHGGTSYVVRSGKNGDYEYVISMDGIFQVERELNRGNSIASYLRKNPEANIEDIAGFDGIFFTQDERSQGSDWKPLRVDRNSNDFKKAIADVEEALEIIRGDNGFADELPEIRNNIVESLAEGVKTIKTKDTPLIKIKNLIFAPLRWVTANFTNSVMGVAAKNAAESLWKYIMSII